MAMISAVEKRVEFFLIRFIFEWDSEDKCGTNTPEHITPNHKLAHLSSINSISFHIIWQNLSQHATKY